MQKAAARAERVNKLVENLERKLGIFTESATGPDDRDVTQSFKTICELEAEYVYATELTRSRPLMLLQGPQTRILWCRPSTMHRICLYVKGEAPPCN